MNDATTMTKRPRRQLSSLEMGRFLAATFVALFHFTGAIQDFRGSMPLGGLFRFGHFGVEYFFILSGFLIFYVHSGDIGNRRSIGHFFQKRFLRIYPTYWAAWAAMLMSVVFIPAFSSERTISAYNLIPDILLLPFHGDMIISVSWSLRNEIIFYAIFSLVIFLGKPAWPVFWLWQGLCLLHPLVSPATALRGGPIATTILGVHNIGFGLGVLVASLLSAGKIKKPLILLYTGAVGVTLFAILEWVIGGTAKITFLSLGDPMSPLIYYPFFALLVAGLVALESSASRRTPRIVRTLGGSSYVMYLTHGAVGAVVIRVLGVGPLRILIPPDALLLIMVLSAIATALVVHEYLEKPALRWLTSFATNRRALHTGGEN